MRALVLRPEPQAGRTAAALAERGIDATVAPMLRVEFEPGVVQRILDAERPRPDILVFTSANAVDALRADPEFDLVSGIPVRAVGAATAEAARTAGFADVVMSEGDGAALLADLRASLPIEAVVVHVSGQDRAVHVAEDLAAAGRKARTVVAYRAQSSDKLDADVAEGLAAGAFDVAVVASRRTAEAFRRALGALDLSLPLAKPALIAISAAAAEPLRDALTEVSIATRPDGEALTEGVVALAAVLAKNGGDGAGGGASAGQEQGWKEPDIMARDDRDGPGGANRRKARERSTTIDLTASEVRVAPTAAGTPETTASEVPAHDPSPADVAAASEPAVGEAPPPVVDDSATAVEASGSMATPSGAEAPTADAEQPAGQPRATSSTFTTPRTEAPRPPPEPRGSALGSLAAAAIGGLIVLAGGASLMATGVLPGTQGSGDVTAEAVRVIDQKVAALGEKVDALPAPPPDLAPRVTAVEEALAVRPADTDVSGEVAALASRVDALAATPASTGGATPDLAPISARIDALSADLSALKASIDTLSGADLAGRIAAVDASVADLKAGLATSQGDLATVRTELAAITQAGTQRDAAAAAETKRVDDIVARLDSGPKGGEIAALSLAVTSLASRLAAGQPYAADLDVVKAAAADAPGMDVLAASAETGIPTLETLAAAFPAEAILAVRPAPGDGPMVNRLFAGAKSLVNYRETGPASDDPIAAGVASIKAALAAGDTAAAKAAGETLPPAAREAGAAWFADLERRASADAVVSALTDSILTRLQAPAEGQ